MVQKTQKIITERPAQQGAGLAEPLPAGGLGALLTLPWVRSGRGTMAESTRVSACAGTASAATRTEGARRLAPVIVGALL